MKVYIAGPMSNRPDNNFPAFREAAKTLRDLGWEVVTPVEMDEAEGIGELDKLDTDEYAACLLRDLKVIQECDGIMLLPGWGASPGSKVERAWAEALGLEVISYVAIRGWKATAELSSSSPDGRDEYPSQQVLNARAALRAARRGKHSAS